MATTVSNTGYWRWSKTYWYDVEFLEILFNKFQGQHSLLMPEIVSKKQDLLWVACNYRYKLHNHCDIFKKFRSQAIVPQ